MKTPDEIKKGLECCIKNSEEACYDCPYMIDCETFDNAGNHSRDALAYITQLEARVPKWISVEDRLPEYFKSVLIYCPTNVNIYDAYLDMHCMWRFFNYGAGQIISEKVTHWMPLPKPPKES